jgi:hypothetical protein
MGSRAPPVGRGILTTLSAELESGAHHAQAWLRHACPRRDREFLPNGLRRRRQNRWG